MPARFTISSQSASAKADLELILEQFAQIQVAATTANAEIAKGAAAAQIPLNDLRLSQEAVTQAVRATVIETVNGQKQKVAAIEAEMAAVRTLTTEYKAGSAERQALISREIELQRALAKATGETAAVSGASAATGRRAGLLGAGGRFTGSVRAEETGVGRGFLSHSTGVGGWIAGPGFIAGALSAIALKQASEALRTIEEEMSQLRGAVANAGKNWKDYRDEVEQTVKAEEALGIKESETLRGMTSLVRVTGSVAKARKEERLATDIARGAHVSMEAAVNAIVQAENGRFRGLQRLIGPIQKVTTYEDQLKQAHIKVTDANRQQVTQLRHRAVEMDKQATIQRVLGQAETKFAGEAERHMKTAEGATDRRRVAIEKLQVSVGRGLLPVEHAVSKAIADVADKLRTSTTLADYLRAMGVTLAASWKVVSAIFTAIAWVLDNRVGRAFLKIAIIAAFPVAGIITHWTKIKKFFEELATFLLAVMRIAWDGIKLGALEAYAKIIEAFSHLPGRMGKWARDAKHDVSAEIAAIKDDMAKQGAIAGDAWGSAFGTNMIKSFEPFLGTLQQQMDSMNPSASTVPGAAAARAASAGAPPRPFSQRVFGPTPGLSALQGKLPGPKGSPAIQFGGHAKKSYHYSGEALDIGDGGNPAQLISDWNFLYPLRNNFAELIWNPPLDVQARAPGSGAGYFWGISGKFSGHKDHIHVAFTGTPKELQSILSGKTTTAAGSGKPPPKGTEESRESFAEKAREAAAIGERSKKKKKAKRVTGLSLRLDTGKLNQEQQDNARLIYKTAIANGLTPTQALEMVAAAYAESNLMTNALNKSSGAFGLFQLLSPGYRKAYEHYLSMGYDPATANVMAIVKDYAKYFKSHPNAAPGEAGAAVEGSGQGAAFYRKGIGSTFSLTGGKAQSAVDTVRNKIKAEAKKLRELVTKLVTDPENVEGDIAGRVTGARQRMIDVGAPIGNAAQAMIDQLTKLKARLERMIASGIVSKAALAAIRSQVKEVGKALASELEQEANVAERAHSRLVGKIRQVVQRQQDAQMKIFDRDTQSQLNAMRKAFEKQMRDFDRETQRGLQSFVVKETPAEAALRTFQEQRQAEADAKTMADAIASGDPEQIRQAQLDQQEKYLDKSARASREAQDALTADQQEGYQQMRDDLRQSLQEREDAMEQSYQDQRDIARQGLEDLNQAEMDKLDDNIAQWEIWLHEKSQKVQEFWTWLRETYGVGPGDLGTWGSDTPGIQLEGKIKAALIAKAIGGVTGTIGGQPLASGGTIRAPRYIGRGDMIAARLSHNETVIDSDLTDALRNMVKGGGAGGVTVIVPNATLLGRDRDVAREIAARTAPEIQRIIGYRTTL